MIITIAGNVGAGKTALAKRLASELGYESFSMGAIFRGMAKEKGLSIEEFYKALEQDPDLERETDARQEAFMRTHDDIIVQGRISWYFAGKSPFPAFDIFLAVDPDAGAARAGTRHENAGKTIQELRAANMERERSEKERYRMLYGIADAASREHYDLVLDTSALTEEEVFNSVIRTLQEQLKGSKK